MERNIRIVKETEARGITFYMVLDGHKRIGTVTEDPVRMNEWRYWMYDEKDHRIGYATNMSAVLAAYR